MRVKRSKDLESGKKPDPMIIDLYRGKIEVRAPNKFNGYGHLLLTKKEARRLASALLKYTESMK